MCQWHAKNDSIQTVFVGEFLIALVHCIIIKGVIRNHTIAQFYSVPGHSSPSTWYVFMSSLAYLYRQRLLGMIQLHRFFASVCVNVSSIHTSA